VASGSVRLHCESSLPNLIGRDRTDVKGIGWGRDKVRGVRKVFVSNSRWGIQNTAVVFDQFALSVLYRIGSHHGGSFGFSDSEGVQCR
jgi:hypothetical protein